MENAFQCDNETLCGDEWKWTRGAVSENGKILTQCDNDIPSDDEWKWPNAAVIKSKGRHMYRFPEYLEAD